MTITTETARANGKGSLAAHGPRPAPSPVARRRQVPWIVAGALLVLGCALAFAVASSHMAAGENVLALNRPVAAGQALTPADLTTVRLSTSTGLAVVPAAEESSLVGRPAAVALVAGSLLIPAEIGSPPPSAAGFDVVALGLKAGAYPPALGPGDRVEVVPVPSASAPSTASLAGPSSPVRATVIGIDSAPSGSATDVVVSLEVDSADAPGVAALAAAGAASLVELPPAPGR